VFTIQAQSQRRLTLAVAIALVFSLAPAGSALGETVEPRPELRVFPESLSLAATVGGQASAKATLANTGNVALKVESVHPPSAPFSASGLPAEGQRIQPGQEFVVEVAFKPTGAGSSQSALSVKTEAGVDEVALSGAASAPAPSESTPPIQLTTPASSVVSTQGSAPPSSAPEPPPVLTRLQVRASTAATARHARMLSIAYTQSSAGTVELAVLRPAVSHRCAGHVRSCVRWIATKVKLKATGRSGHNHAALDASALGAGAYRLDARPLAHSGDAGTTQHVSFRLAR
jgi:hypothetical protein